MTDAWVQIVAAKDCAVKPSGASKAEKSTAGTRAQEAFTCPVGSQERRAAWGRGAAPELQTSRVVAGGRKQEYGYGMCLVAPAGEGSRMPAVALNAARGPRTLPASHSSPTGHPRAL
jgi:hypothetical protein